MDIEVANRKSGIIINLQERGYDVDFVLNNGSISCVQDRSLTKPEGFEITEKHLIVDNRCLENTCVIFAVRIIDNHTKGILMTSYRQRRNHAKKKSNYESQKF
jgi:hypothetical protein